MTTTRQTFKVMFASRHDPQSPSARGQARIALWYLRQQAGKPVGGRGHALDYAYACDAKRMPHAQR